MKQIFELIFKLRYIKPCELKITFSDFRMIFRYYWKNRLFKYIKFKKFYYIIVEDSLENFHTFDIALKFIHRNILQKELEDRWLKKK